MKVVRALFGGLLATALVVACGSDSKGDATSTSTLSKCASGSTMSDACQTCEQRKCSAELHKCYGSNFNGGVCKALVACANDASDACHSDCTPEADCQSCITDDLVSCLQANCASECNLSSNPAPGKATCADLGPCCEMIIVASAKTGCQGLVSDGNETICGSYYESLRSFCDK
jgi:hypothetical protein